MTATFSRRPAIDVKIGRPVTAADWARARELVGSLLQWTVDMLGDVAVAAQKGADVELDQLVDIYSAPQGSFLIARVDGEVVGTAAVRLLSPRTAELKRVYVKPAARGLGLASRMLEAAIDAARRCGASRMVLESHSEVMRSAVEMYRRRGFHEIPDYTDLSTHVPGAIAMEMRL